jgi:hypothetical protein
MRRILVLGLLLPLSFFSVPALADALFKNGQIEIHFYSTSCEMTAIGNFLKQFGEAKSALVVFGGQRIRACYAVDEDGDFVIVDERGAGGIVPGKAVNVGS